MEIQQMALLLAAVLGVLLAPKSVQGAGALFRGTAIKPSPASGHYLMARSEQPQLTGSLQDRLPNDAAAQPRQAGLRQTTTIIKTTIITVTETTVLQKVSTKSLSLFFTVTATSPCIAKVQPGMQDELIDAKPVNYVKPSFGQGIVAPKQLINDYSMLFNNPLFSSKPIRPMPVRDVKPVKAKPVEDKPVVVEPFVSKPVATKPVEHNPAKAELVESKPVESNPVESKPVEPKPVESKPVETSPVEANPVKDTLLTRKPGHHSPVYVFKPSELSESSKPSKPSNVNEEFIKLLAEFTMLMSKLGAPPSQSALVGRFRNVSRKEDVWKSYDKAVHHEELTDELRLLVRQIKDVNTQPEEFFEHLETFVSYMEEI